MSTLARSGPVFTLHAAPFAGLKERLTWIEQALSTFHLLKTNYTTELPSPAL